MRHRLHLLISAPSLHQYLDADICVSCRDAGCVAGGTEPQPGNGGGGRPLGQWEEGRGGGGGRKQDSGGG